MSRLNNDNAEHIYRTWQMLETVEPKLGDFFVLAFVVSNSSTGYLTLPRRFVCDTLNLKAERYRILLNALLNLHILMDDYRWDKKVGCCVHYLMRPLEKSRLPELIGLGEDEFKERAKAIISEPIPKADPNDPYDFHLVMWRESRGKRVSINGAPNSRAPKVPKKSAWPMKYGSLLPNNPFTDKPPEGTASAAANQNASVDKQEVVRTPRMTERAKSLYKNSYRKTLLTFKEIESNSITLNNMNNSPSDCIHVSQLCSVSIPSTGDSGSLNDPHHETVVVPTPQTCVSASQEAAGGADAVPEAPKLDPIEENGLKLVPATKAVYGFFNKPKPETLMGQQFHGADPMELGYKERVQYLWFTFNRIVKRFPALKQHPMPAPLAKGTYEFKESGNPTLDRMYEWAAKEEWFVHWTICLYRISKNKFLHDGTKDWKLTIHWLFRSYMELDLETDEAIDRGLNIDEKVLGVNWGISDGYGAWYKRYKNVSLLDEGYQDAYVDGLCGSDVLAHRGLAEFDPWFDLF
jgi:hypothetical protein